MGKEKKDKVKYCEKLKELDVCNIFTPHFNIENETHLAKVVYCYDGDTVHCVFKHDRMYQKFKVRMWGYNTPEMRPSKKIPEEERQEIIKKANEAKNRLSDLIINKNVILECKGFDSFGRVLGEIKLLDSNTTINQQMIDEGFGVEFYG